MKYNLTPLVVVLAFASACSTQPPAADHSDPGPMALFDVRIINPTGPASGTGVVGQVITVSSTCTNTGTLTFGPSTTGIYLSTSSNGLGCACNCLVTSHTVAAIAAKSSRTTTTNFVVPASSPTGNVLLCFVANDRGLPCASGKNPPVRIFATESPSSAYHDNTNCVPIYIKP